MYARLAVLSSTLLLFSLCSTYVVEVTPSDISGLRENSEFSTPEELAKREMRDHWPRPVTETKIEVVTVQDDGKLETVTETVSKTPRCRWTELDLLNSCLEQSALRCGTGNWECECRSARKLETCFQRCPEDDRHALFRQRKHEACSHAYAVPRPQILKPTGSHRVVEPYTVTREINVHGTIPGSKTIDRHRQVLKTDKVTKTVFDYRHGREATISVDKHGHTIIPIVYQKHRHGHKNGASPNLVAPGFVAVAGGALGLVALAL